MISGYPMHEKHLRYERAVRPNLTYHFVYIDFDQQIIKWEKLCLCYKITSTRLLKSKNALENYRTYFLSNI